METAISVVLGGAFLGFVQFLISRHDSKKDKKDGITAQLKCLKHEVSKLNGKIDRNEAILARTHILRFSDELQNDISHSQDYFRQTLDDIKTYDAYCKVNPEFSNGYTKASAKFIQDTYQKLLDKHEFSKGEI